MNDTKLADAVKSGLTEARDSLSNVHLAIPASEIMARTDQARRHRRLGVLAGAGGVAGVAVALSVALSASHPAASDSARGPGARPAAWAVSRRADGTILLNFYRALRDPAALQRTLRADGLPASVTFIGQQNPACKPYPMPPSPHKNPIAWYIKHHQVPDGPLTRVTGGPLNSHYPPGVMVFVPSALPRGAGLQLAVMRGIPKGPGGPWPYPKGSGHPVTEESLVRVSPQCTGS